MSTSDASPSLHDELGELSGKIPEALRGQIEAAVAEVQKSGQAPGLEVGNHAPDFTLPDALGHNVSLTEHLAHGPVVLTFYRGEWCPYCNLQLRALQGMLPSFDHENATLIAISPQSPDHSLSISEKHALTFPVLSDVHQEIIAAYKVQFTMEGVLRNLHVNVFHNDPRDKNADGSFNLPVPATFVIDRSGTIRARFINPDWRIRMEPAAILDELRALHAEGPET